MQTLNPLAVFPVRLASGRDLDLAGIDQEYAYAARFEDLINRQPVDAGRFHRHRINPTNLEPVGQRVEIGRESGEGANRTAVTIGGHTGVDLVGADIEAGCVGMDTRQGITVSSSGSNNTRWHTTLHQSTPRSGRPAQSQRRYKLSDRGHQHA